LFNLFLKEERSIVTETPGTTRDWLEAWLDLAGIPMRLYDTAGLRERASDPVETEGIRRTNAVLEAADVVVYVVDGVEGFSESDRRRIETYADTRRVVTVWNKSDIAGPPPPGLLSVSAATGLGFTELERELVEIAFAGGAPPDGDAPVIDSFRQKERLEGAAAALDRFAEGVESGTVSFDLLAEDLRDALDALGEITGEVTPVDILETLFSDFCVGK
jgi:tRNA modification GTPase